MKRIIGISGDHVQVLQGRLILNGEKISRTLMGNVVIEGDGPKLIAMRYIETLPSGRSYEIAAQSHDGMLDNTSEYVVPKNSIFTMGDNRDNSLDSRVQNAVGFVPTRNLVAVITRVLSPVR
jgi:signal peptidase I